MIIYQNKFGYIEGYQKPDGTWWLSQVYILPEFRGKGCGVRLMAHAPANASLLAYPNLDCTLTPKQLIKFYEKCGFHLVPNDYGNPTMSNF